MSVWSCKIGEAGALPDGADLPMRTAIRAAYLQLTGEEPEFLFSGWGAELTEGEREAVESMSRSDSNWDSRQTNR